MPVFHLGMRGQFEWRTPMARGQKASNPGPDGMSWLALAPFPAWNPLNWWALASPRNAMLASITNTEIALDAWRAAADSMRALMRLQQDDVLKSLHMPFEKNEGAETAPSKEDDEAADDDVAPFLVRPMIEATRAYNRMGRAFIVAQRDTLRALAPETKPH